MGRAALVAAMGDLIFLQEINDLLKRKQQQQQKPYHYNAEKGYLLCHLQHLFDFEQFVFGVGQISLCAVNRHLALCSLLKCRNNQPEESQYYCMLTELCKDNPLSRTHQCQKQ